MKNLSEAKKARNARRRDRVVPREPYTGKSGFKYCGCERRISINKETCKECSLATV